MGAAGLARALAKPAAALAFFSSRSKEAEAGPARAGHLWLPRSWRAVFCGLTQQHALGFCGPWPGGDVCRFRAPVRRMRETNLDGGDRVRTSGGDGVARARSASVWGPRSADSRWII